SKVILLRQSLKTFLKSVLKEAQSINSSEEMVREYIIKKKELLENIYKMENIQENKKILEDGADILYIALVCEVIPNILTLKNLAMDLEQFTQIAYLSPSIKRDESAKRLFEMEK
ncbi:30468_t:CDS:2, partial [Racocetra persica]